MKSQQRAFILTLVLSVGISQAADIFVDPTAGGENDGTSWKNAYTFLQDGIADAGGGDTIHVAAGVYYPDEGNGQSNNSLLSTFSLPGGTALLGGYKPGGGSRDPDQFLTVLSGDISGNDDNSDGNFIAETPNDLNGTNALHVVTIANTNVTLDGLVITAGYAIEVGTNQAFGGGLLVTANGLEVRDCRFAGNRSRLRGGAVFVDDANPVFVNCTFSGNVSDDFGGALAAGDAIGLHFVNSVFFGNEADFGGAMYLDKCSPRLTNCSLSGNSGSVRSGSIEAIQNSVVTLENTIVWNNHDNGVTTGTSISLLSGSTNSITTCLIQNDGGSDPQFLTPPNPGSAPSSIGNLDIAVNSPAVNEGTSGLNSEPFDIAGEDRVADGVIDIGAYEGLAGIFVDSTASGTNDGSSWQNAFIELQDALAAAESGDRVWIAAGVYYPDQGSGQVNNDRNSTFDIDSGLTILGGYPAGGGLRNITANPTILSGDLQQNDLNFDGNHIIEDVTQIVGGNAYSIVTVTGNLETVAISGLTVTAGLEDYIFGDGAGIFAKARLILEDCVLIGNQCKDSGAGLFARASSIPGFPELEIEIRRCQFISNAVIRGSADGAGAGLSFEGKRLVVSNCHFEDNSVAATSGSRNEGYAIQVKGKGIVPSCVIEDCTIINNRCNLTRTAVSIREMSATITRCNFSGNDSRPNGLVVSSTLFLTENSETLIRDCAFTGNFAGATIRASIPSSSPLQPDFSLRNITIAGNSGTSFRTGSPSGPATLLIGNCVFDQPFGTTDDITVLRSHSLIAGQPADGSGNLPDTTIPGFLNPRPPGEAPTTAGDYRLLSTSPLIDVGLNTATTSTIDLLGFTRIFDGDSTGGATIDLGAYEYDGSPDPVFADIEITDIAYDENNGQVTLTVESSSNTTYTAQFSLSLQSWSFAQSGSLTTGTNTLIIPGTAYGSPQEKAFLRLVTP